MKAAFEGLRFVFRAPLIRSTMLLDFFATFFSSATALLPIFAQDILRVGAHGYGWLYAAPAVGALIASGLMVPAMQVIERRGVALLVAVVVYGFATVAFGLSTSFWLTFWVLALSGGADSVSTIYRNVIRQLETPDELRGRMTGVNMVFFMGGPQLGELEAGLVANWIGAPLSVVTGGIGCLLATAMGGGDDAAAAVVREGGGAGAGRRARRAGPAAADRHRASERAGWWPARLELHLGVPPHDRGPLAHPPARDQTVLHVRIGLRERLRNLGRGAAEQQDRAVGRLVERAAQHQLAAVHGGPGVGEVHGAEGRAPLGVVRHDVVEEEIVHSGSVPHRSGVRRFPGSRVLGFRFAGSRRRTGEPREPENRRTPEPSSARE